MTRLSDQVEGWLAGVAPPTWTIEPGDPGWVVRLTGWPIPGHGETVRAAAEMAVDQARVQISHRHREAVMTGGPIPYGGSAIWYLPDRVIEQIVAGHDQTPQPG